MKTRGKFEDSKKITIQDIVLDWDIGVYQWTNNE